MCSNKFLNSEQSCWHCGTNHFIKFSVGSSETEGWIRAELKWLPDIQQQNKSCCFYSLLKMAVMLLYHVVSFSHLWSVHAEKIKHSVDFLFHLLSESVGLTIKPEVGLEEHRLLDVFLSFCRPGQSMYPIAGGFSPAALAMNASMPRYLCKLWT